MHRWLALMDDHGRELTYLPNYHRQRIPWPVDQDWIVVEFGRIGNSLFIPMVGIWVCDSESSRMRDGEWFKCERTLVPGENLNVHFRGEVPSI